MCMFQSPLHQFTYQVTLTLSVCKYLILHRWFFPQILEVILFDRSFQLAFIAFYRIPLHSLHLYYPLFFKLLVQIHQFSLKLKIEFTLAAISL